MLSLQVVWWGHSSCWVGCLCWLCWLPDGRCGASQPAANRCVLLCMAKLQQMDAWTERSDRQRVHVCPEQCSKLG